MSIQLFSGRGAKGEYVRLPLAYRRSVRWLPQIGDIFPDFTATTTCGPLRFHDWAEGNWVFFFSHPAAFTPVCTTELASFAMSGDEFRDRGVKVLGLSRDQQEDQIAWTAEIERLFDVQIGFPIVEDLSGSLSSSFGMIHGKVDKECTIRKSFVIDPALRIRMIFEYPANIGRNTAETLRVIDALQMADKYEVCLGSDWQLGDDCIVHPRIGNARARHLYGKGMRAYCNYLRVVKAEALTARISELLPFVDRPAPPASAASAGSAPRLRPVPVDETAS